MYYRIVFFFFFQAEDGIRDKLVTGVQTCALPISAGGGAAGGASDKTSAAGTNITPPRSSPPSSARAARASSTVATTSAESPAPNARSEERRVGKECRSRWGADE